MSEQMINSLRKKLKKKGIGNNSELQTIRKSISIKPNLPFYNLPEEYLENTIKIKKNKITNQIILNKLREITPKKNKNYRSLEKSPRIFPEDLYRVKNPLSSEKIINKFSKLNSIRHDLNLLSKLGLQKLPNLSLNKQKILIKNSMMNNLMIGTQGHEINIISNQLDNKYIESQINNLKDHDINNSTKIKDVNNLLSNYMTNKNKISPNKPYLFLNNINQEDKSTIDHYSKYNNPIYSNYNISYETKKIKNSVIAANNFSQRTSFSIPTFNSFVRKPNQPDKPKIKILLNKEFIDKLLDHISDSDD